jgi:hypothetical protein
MNTGTCSIGSPARHVWLTAGLNRRDFRGSVGSTKSLEIHAASGKQIVNPALEVT